MNDLPLRPAAEIGAVEDRFFTSRNFPLTDGTVMPEATIAYETYGRLAPDRRNAILWTHGYTGSHHFAGRNPANGNQPGSWDGLIGPGKTIDTDKLFVVASNMLGSSFGSTNAGSINPQSGEAYGPDFPNITIRDIVAAQKALLDHLGVRHLVAVAGPSYGGYPPTSQTFASPTARTRARGSQALTGRTRCSVSGRCASKRSGSRRDHRPRWAGSVLTRTATRRCCVPLRRKTSAARQDTRNWSAWCPAAATDRIIKEICNAARELARFPALFFSVLPDLFVAGNDTYQCLSFLAEGGGSLLPARSQ